MCVSFIVTRYSYTFSLTSALDGGAVVTRRFTLGEDARYRQHWRLCVWMDVTYLAPPQRGSNPEPFSPQPVAIPTHYPHTHDKVVPDYSVSFSEKIDNISVQHGLNWTDFLRCSSHRCFTTEALS